jgi:hypothetical protein
MDRVMFHHKGCQGSTGRTPWPVGIPRRAGRVGYNRHLNDLIESIAMNVGGPCVEGSSPPMKRTGVGGVIVLGGWENHLHGEGRQGIDVWWTISRRSSGEVRVSPVKLAAPMKEEPMTEIREIANPRRAGCGKSRMPGSEGGVRKHDS